MTLTEHATEILRWVSMPEGCVIAQDNRTDNLVVTYRDHGFAITHFCLDDWPIERVVHDIEKAIADLVAGRSSDVCTIQTCEEMNLARVMPCGFDP